MAVSMQKMQHTMSIILTIGTLLSLAIVALGGGLYLLKNGHQSMAWELLQTNNYATTLPQIWEAAITFSPLGIVEAGLLLLVATQVIRVGLLVWFYLAIRDVRFAMISIFVLALMLYSLVWRG